MNCSPCRGSAGGELETADSRQKADGARRLAGRSVIHLCVPESAVVTGINRHPAVIAPAIIGGVRLPSGAVYQSRFALGQSTRRIGSESAGVANSGKDRRGARNAITDSQVSLIVFGGAAHPTADVIAGRTARSKGRLFLNHKGAAGRAAQFVIARRGAESTEDSRSRRAYCVVHHQRFVAALIAVLHSMHYPVGDCVH